MYCQWILDLIGIDKDPDCGLGTVVTKGEEEEVIIKVNQGIYKLDENWSLVSNLHAWW